MVLQEVLLMSAALNTCRWDNLKTTFELYAAMRNLEVYTLIKFESRAKSISGSVMADCWGINVRTSVCSCVCN